MGIRMELMMMIGASILIMGSVMNVAEAEEVIHVGGKVLCQDCTQGWNEWVTGAKPIKGLFLYPPSPSLSLYMCVCVYML